MRKTYANARLQASYGLAIEKAQSLVALKLPAMTLMQAESSRDTLAAMGKHVHVVNLKAE